MTVNNLKRRIRIGIPLVLVALFAFASARTAEARYYGHHGYGRGYYGHGYGHHGYYGYGRRYSRSDACALTLLRRARWFPPEEGSVLDT